LVHRSLRGPRRFRRLPDDPSVRFSSRRSDDADVIRARLRVLLDERAGAGGWLPDDDLLPDDDRPTAPLDENDEPGPPLPSLGRHRAPDAVVRWNPGRPAARSLWIAGLLAALVLVLWTWLQRPTVEPVQDASAPVEEPTTSTTPVGEAADTSSTVVVSVVGPVARPGLVTLPAGARIADALEAAGGLLPDADPSSVNLAAVVADGQQVVVGVPGAAPATAAAGDGATSGGVVNLNTAGIAELDALPGIGPVLAQRIVDHRTREGPFSSVDQLDDVPGIGPSIFAELADLVGV
jgi:competence protein ComEA